MWSAPQSVPLEPVAVVGVPFGHVQVFARHVSALPAAAGALIVWPGSHAEQSTCLPVSHRVRPTPDATVGVPPGQVHVLAAQVWALPAAAGSLIVWPRSHVEQSSCLSVSHRVPPVPDATAGVPSGQVHVLAAQVRVLLAAGLRRYPSSQASQSSWPSVSQSVSTDPSAVVGVPFGHRQ